MARPEYVEWLRFARDDLEAAEFLLSMKPRKIEIICYHCQQCAEKALKAVLALFDDEIPRSHDLRLLMKQCQLRVPALDRLIDVLPRLQPFAVAVRYPHEPEAFDGDEIKAIENAKRVLSTVAESCATLKKA